MRSYEEVVFWNSLAYGRNYFKKIDKRKIKRIFILFCLITPATNWLIPINNIIIDKVIKALPSKCRFRIK